MTLAELAREAARKLAAAGHAPDASTRDAALLARHVLGWDAARWAAASREAAPPDFLVAYAPLIERRAAHEPIAYILGEREFYGRMFKVTRDTLIPRPETELVVDEALRWHRAQTARGVSVADVGTGSGCLAITLALELPESYVVATDTSATALAVARQNAAALGATDRIMFRASELLGGAIGFDLIVANLPYVGEADRASLPAEVREYEPAAALFAGNDGLDVLRRFVPQTVRALTPGGALILEIGVGQSDAVAELIASTGSLRVDRIARDLQGIARCVVAVRDSGFLSS